MMSEVTITHAGPEHAGEYRCLARNLYGSDELIFRLFVKGDMHEALIFPQPSKDITAELKYFLFHIERPATPEEVRVSEVWSRRARVTWRVARGAMVSHYSLQYRALTRDLSSATLDAPLPALLDTWDSPEVLNLTLTNSDLLHVA